MDEDYADRSYTFRQYTLIDSVEIILFAVFSYWAAGYFTRNLFASLSVGFTAFLLFKSVQMLTDISCTVSRDGMRVKSLLHTKHIKWEDIVSMSTVLLGHSVRYQIKTGSETYMLPPIDEVSRFGDLVSAHANLTVVHEVDTGIALAALKRWTKKGVPYRPTGVVDAMKDIVTVPASVNRNLMVLFLCLSVPVYLVITISTLYEYATRLLLFLGIRF